MQIFLFLLQLHGRSREQRYTKNANWEYIEEAASKVKNIPVIGNGDILTFEDYNEKRVSDRYNFISIKLILPFYTTKSYDSVLFFTMRDL